jgi:hypothetical protein
VQGLYTIHSAGKDGAVMVRSEINGGQAFAVEPSRLQPRRVKPSAAAVIEDRFTLQAQSAAQQVRAGAAESDLQVLHDESSASATASATALDAEQRKSAKRLRARVRQHPPPPFWLFLDLCSWSAYPPPWNHHYPAFTM